jgi:Tn3 transposase DDE domain
MSPLQFQKQLRLRCALKGRIRGAFQTAAWLSMNESIDSLSMRRTPRCAPFCDLTHIDVIWNTIHIQKIVDQLRAAGETVKDEDIARTWPLLHAHIIPNGMYDFSSC